MFLLVPAYPGCPVPKAVKRLCVLWQLVCASRTHTRLCRQSPSGLSDGLCQRVTRVEIFKLTYAAELILAGIEFHDIFGS